MVIKKEAPTRRRDPDKTIKSDYSAKRRVQVDLFMTQLGVLEHELDEIGIEAIRCKGRDHKERRMIRRYWQRETDWKDAGTFIDIWEVSSPTEKKLATIGPFEADSDSVNAYNAIIRNFGFDKGLLIPDPDGIEEDEDEWGESVSRPSDDLDWDSTGDDDDDDPWGDNDDPDDDDGWS